jgi:uncharacterized protein (DUF1330 family)
MPKAYWIAAYRSVNDPEALAAYPKLAGPAIRNAGGRNPSHLYIRARDG